MAQQTNQDATKLYDLPEVDAEMLYLYEWYCEVKGAENLTYSEIQSWDKLRCNGITPDETAVLMLIDMDFYSVRNGDTATE